MRYGDTWPTGQQSGGPAVSVPSQAIYRWTGVTRSGERRHGATQPTESLGKMVEGLYQAGWRYLMVCAGEGPVPPSFADQGQVAGIGKHPDTGRRVCWWEGEARP
jgi:hypothetical protein